MHVARDVYDKVLNGDPIGDEELIQAKFFFEDLAAKLVVLGPVFRLAANEATRVHNQLLDFSVARVQRR